MRVTARGDANQPVEQAPNAPATHANIARVCQVMAQLLQQQQQMQATSRPTQSLESYYERFKKLNPSLFDGGANPLVAKTWIREMEKMFDALQYLKDMKVRLAICMLKGNAELWWIAIKVASENADDQLTWEEFKKIFYDQYFFKLVKLEKKNKLLASRQHNDITVLKYTNKFNELSRFYPELIESKRSKENRFKHGLGYKIWSRLFSHHFNNYKDVLE